MTFESITIRYTPISFEIDVKDEKEIMDIIAGTKIASIIMNLISEIISARQ